jgi:hypothetical protein
MVKGNVEINKDETDLKESNQDEENALDCLLISSENFIAGEIDIIFNEIYNLPSPYMKVWYASNGEIVTHSELRKFFKNLDKDEPFVDHQFSKFGTLMIDTHPLTNNYCLSIHICDLERRLQPMNHQINEQIQLNMNLSLQSEQLSLLFLLHWLNHLGPHLGLVFSPAYYKYLYDKIMNIAI